jgi:hypothetical protein
MSRTVCRRTRGLAPPPAARRRGAWRSSPARFECTARAPHPRSGSRRARRAVHRRLGTAGRDRGAERRVRRRVTGLAGVGARLYAGEVPVDACARRHLVLELALGEGTPERRSAGGPTRTDAAGRLARNAPLRALVESRTAPLELDPDAHARPAVAPRALDLGPEETGRSPLRSRGEPVPALLLRGRLCDLTRGDILAEARRVTAVLSVRSARLDTGMVTLQTAVERVLEGAGRARSALLATVARRLETGIGALATCRRRRWTTRSRQRALRAEPTSAARS